MTCFLALDQGTSSSRALLFDADGGIRASAQHALAVHYPRPGWVEQDPVEIWTSQREAAQKALARAQVQPRDVAALGMANQRETTIIWNRKTGKPIGPAIVWQDRRTSPYCNRLRARGVEDTIRAKTGLRLDPYFSAPKIGWLLAHVEGARDRARRGELAFGTVDTWLLWNLSGGRLHATDITNASRTLLCNINTRDWDPELLDLFDIPRALLPEVRACASRFGEAALADGRIAITGVAGDQPAALLGQNGHRSGDTKNTYGTGAFVLMHTGTERRQAAGLLAGPVCHFPGESPAYGLEGSVFVCGALVQWLRDGLGLIEHAADVEKLAREVPDAGGVTVVPAFTGLGAPYWDASARGTILGLTRGTTAAHIARASLEAMALRTCDVVQAMQASTTTPVPALRVDGGAAANDLLLQLQADLLGLPILRSRTTEATATGAAMLAAAGAGSMDCASLREWWQPDTRFDPRTTAPERTRRYRQWQRGCARARDWANDAGD